MKIRKNGLSRLEIKREKVITTKDEKQSHKEYMRIVEHEGYQRKQDKELLFKIMSKHMEKWWI